MGGGTHCVEQHHHLSALLRSSFWNKLSRLFVRRNPKLRLANRNPWNNPTSLPSSSPNMHSKNWVHLSSDTSQPCLFLSGTNADSSPMIQLICNRFRMALKDPTVVSLNCGWKFVIFVVTSPVMKEEEEETKHFIKRSVCLSLWREPLSSFKESRWVRPLSLCKESRWVCVGRAVDGVPERAV